MEESTLTVVMPAHNEVEAIVPCINEVRSALPDATLIVVDDGSTDGTSAALETVKASDQLMVLRHSSRRGYGASLKTGMHAARTSLVGFMDADLTYDAAGFSRMLPLLSNGAECVSMDRFGSTVNEMPALRKFGNKMLTFAFNRITGAGVPDCASGQWLFTRAALIRVNPETLPDGPGFIGGLAARVVRRGIRHAVIPVEYRRRVGRSKLRSVSGFFSILYPVMKEL